MARPANPENRYSFTCKVTGETVKTNPKQFAALANRYGITNEELDVSYVSRAGRRIIADEKLTPEQAVEKYGIHLNVAKSLKCTVKEKVQKVKATAETSATETPVSEQTEDQPTDALVEAINNAAIEVSETPVQDEQSVETVVSETPVESGEEVSA